MKRFGGLALGAELVLCNAAEATVLDVYNSSNPSTAFDQITMIDTAQTGQDHYDFSSASGHPSGVPLGDFVANLWVHQDTNNSGDYSFGFIFSQDNSGFSQDNSGVPTNNAQVNFRIVNSDTPVFISQGDEATEVSQPNPDTFLGNFTYANNSHGIMVSGITGTDWAIIIDSVSFGSVMDWNAASGDADHVALTLGDEYRITLEGNSPSTFELLPEPGQFALLGAGLLGIAWMRRRRTA